MINSDPIRSVTVERYPIEDEILTLEDVLTAELARDGLIHDAPAVQPTLFDPPAPEPESDVGAAPEAATPDRLSPAVPLIPVNDPTAEAEGLSLDCGSDSMGRLTDDPGPAFAGPQPIPLGGPVSKRLAACPTPGSPLLPSRSALGHMPSIANNYIPVKPLILTVHTGRARGTRVPIQISPFRIGRHPDCHLTVHHECVSRWHCTLHWHGRWWLKDDESTHGTVVNGTAIHGRKVPLDPGAEIVVGPLRLTVVADTRQPTLARFQFQTAVQAGLAVRLLPPTTVPVGPGFFPVPPVPRPQPRPAPARRPPPPLTLPPNEPTTPATEPIPLTTDNLPVPVESAVPVETMTLAPPAPAPVPPSEPTDQRLNTIYRNALQPPRQDPKPNRSHPWSLLAATVLLTAVGAWYWFVPSGRHAATTERSGHFAPLAVPPPITPIRPPTKPGRPGRRGIVAPYYGYREQRPNYPRREPA
jgi:hypothetical protein